MIHLERNLDMNASPEAIWAEIGRYMEIDDFSPYIVSVDALTDGEDGMGSIRRNNFDNGSSMVEEVIQWTPNKGYRVRSSEFGSNPMTEMTAELAIKPASKGKSKMSWSIDYRMKYGPLGWLMGQIMVKRFMSKVIDTNLKALDDKVQSNQAAAVH